MRPFRKESVLQQFVRYIICGFIEVDMNFYDQEAFKRYEMFGKMPPLYAERLLFEYGNGYPFESENYEGRKLVYRDIEDYLMSILITAHLEKFCEKIADEVFYILFNNRNLLSVLTGLLLAMCRK